MYNIRIRIAQSRVDKYEKYLSELQNANPSGIDTPEITRVTNELEKCETELAALYMELPINERPLAYQAA